MYVRNLKVKDLRAFRTLSIDFLYPGRRLDDGFDFASKRARLPNVNILLGVNGSGKSTILDAIALGVLSPLISSSGYRPYALVRRSNRGAVPKASVSVDLTLHEQDGVEIKSKKPVQSGLETTIERRGDVEFVNSPNASLPIWERMYDDSSPAFFLVGYGAMRRVEAVSASDLAVRRKSRLLRYERVASLFEDHFALIPFVAWLPEWESRNPGRYRQVVNLINRLTPPSIRFTGKMEGGEYLFEYRKLPVPFGALSDGYRAYLGWIGDLLYHLCMGAPSGAKLVESRGVVLVDEIDLHIHPAWQRTIIPTLARTLKNLQFIFTTHSPLVVGTMERINIANVLRGKNGFPVVERPEEETFGLSADQILRSDAFGLESSRDPEFRQKLLALEAQIERGTTGAAIQFMREAALGTGNVAPLEEREPPEWLRKLASD